MFTHKQNQYVQKVSIPKEYTDEMTESRSQQGTALGQGQKTWLRTSWEALFRSIWKNPNNKTN